MSECDFCDEMSGKIDGYQSRICELEEERSLAALEEERRSSEMDALRSRVAVLDTPMPCGWPAPEVYRWKAGDDGSEQSMVMWAVMEPVRSRTAPYGIDPDEASALGAALIRAALEAKSHG